MDLWQLLVFGSESARGNPTGVLLNAPVLETGLYQSIAGRLGFPDSIFVWPAVNAWTARAFSPSEEVSFCIQALLGTSAVLRRAGLAPSAGAILLSMGERVVSVSSTGSGTTEVHWLEMPAARITEANVPALRDFVTLPPEGGPEVVLDAGRRRVYRLLDSIEALEQAVAAPEQVLGYCRAADVHGVCLLAMGSEDMIRMRVFTTSLDGHEDAATGGAASAIPEYLARVGNRTPLGHVWLVHQGSGPSHRRGTLYVSNTGAGVRVGGLVQFVACGTVLPEALRGQAAGHE